MDTYGYFMSFSRWLLLAGIVWLPGSLLAQSGLMPTEAGGRTDTVRVGMGVFGNVLGIHGADTLALQGDLVLVEAEVVGEGVLSLCANRPQKIMAQKSSIQNLYVANPTKVIVQGDLIIRKSLVIENGVLDSRMATLMLADTCRFRVGNGAQILWPKNTLLVKQASTIPDSRPDPPTAWEATWQEVTSWKRGRFSAAIQLSDQLNGWVPEEITPPSPPPEPVNKGAFVGRV
jgi:hypothetical protein